MRKPISLSVVSLQLRYGDLKMLEIAKRAGFDAVDMDVMSYGHGKLPDVYRMPQGEFEEYFDGVKRYAAQLGIGIAHTHNIMSAYRPNDEAYNRDLLARCKRGIEATRLLGCRYTVTHCINSYRWGEDTPPEVMHRENQRMFADFLDVIEANGVYATLESFGVQAKLTHVTHGPAITRYELQPAPGVKVSRIVGLVDDIALNMAADGVRIEAPIPGKPAVGIEIPNEKIETVSLRDVLESPEMTRQKSPTAVALGKGISGAPVVADMAKMPHVLIAGATGSGKSVCINTIINSIIYRASPKEVRLILIDPKVVELSVYNGIPHLLVPVVTDPKKASAALSWAVVEMEHRYKRFETMGVRNIEGYNHAIGPGEEPMSKIIVIIDELADLMMVAPGEVEESICRLAQLARAAGIHLVIATQRPSVNVITGVIKANIPSRIAFAVSSQIDSRTILDAGGAEKLLGKGDMLYAPQGAGKPTRVQGCFVSDDEVQRIVDFVRGKHTAEYNEDVIEQMNAAADEEKAAAGDAPASG